VGDTLTCIFAGFVIFSYLGYMADQLNVEVKDVAKDGIFFLIMFFNLLLHILST